MPSASLIAKPVSQLTTFLGRLFTPPNDSIRGVDADSWYSPLQPVKPMGPVDEEPKAFQYWAGQNLLWTPRPDAEYTAWDLKALAVYPLARMCVENVKDSISRIPWQIQLKRKPGESKKDHAKRAEGNKELVKINKFFERPDREHDFDAWIRPLIEDMLVIDAASIIVRKTFSGDVVELIVGRGEMFTRYIDRNGLTPLPPDPAYAQIWWGIPLANLTTEQLIYKPRNIVPRATISSQLYGMSPIEQLAQEITVGQKRLDFVTAYYTAGSIPDVVQVVPKGVPPNKIAEAMQWMNSELAGNLAARRQWRMVQGFAEAGKDDQIVFAKEKLMADAFDEMHIRKVAFGLYTSPQRLMRMMGTRNAESQQEASENENLIPLLDWVKSVRDHITQVTFGYTDFESVYDAEREPDPAKQAERLKVLVGNTIITPNQAREEMGMEPDEADEANMLGVITANGFVPLSAQSQLERQQVLGTDPDSVAERQKDVAASKPAPSAPGKPATAAGKPNGHAKPNGKAINAHFGFAEVLDETAPLTKGFAATIVKPVIDPRALTPQSQLALRRLHLAIHNRFGSMRALTTSVLKKKLVKKAKRDEDAILKKIDEQLAAEWELFPAETEDLLAQAALGGASLGSIQVSLTDQDLLSSVNQTAKDWAAKRAAEMVGRRRTATGALVDNPEARWAITDSTRDALQIVARDLFAEDAPTLSSIEARIEQAGIFSDARAAMIARTEISLAQTQGNLASWQGSGLVATVDWQLSGNHDLDDECNDNAEAGPYPVDDVPDCPAHPNCDCVLVLNEFVDEQSTEE